MTEEQAQQPAPTTEAPPQQTAETPPAAPAQPPAETVDWRKALDTIDAKELRSHPRFAGIFGQEIASARERIRAEVLEEQQRLAAETAERELRQLAQQDPAAFAERWLTDAQKADAQRQLDIVNRQTREEFARALGRAYTSVPEWQELTPDEVGKLQTTVQGISEDEVIPRFNVTAIDLVAQKRAAKLFNEWRQKEMAKEREAQAQEIAAKLLQSQQSPGVARPNAVSPVVDVRSMSDKEFDEYWAKLKRKSA